MVRPARARWSSAREVVRYRISLALWQRKPDIGACMGTIRPVSDGEDFVARGYGVSAAIIGARRGGSGILSSGILASGILASGILATDTLRDVAAEIFGRVESADGLTCA